MPDPAFIVERRDRLLGIVATHAHEDHIGAIPYLWPQLQCPIWATPFTASLLRAKLVEVGLLDQVELTVVPLSGRFQIGPFDLELITLTHSIPEPNAVAIRTPVGTIMHTGDWKLDPEPLIGDATDEAALIRDRRRGRPRDGRRLDQCDEGGHIRLRGRIGGVAYRADRTLRGPRRGRLLRLECRAAAHDRPCRAGAWP